MVSRENVSTIDLQIAREFGKDYFDGDRKYGYGGYYYNDKYWTKTVSYMKQYYSIHPNASILDVGCGKGFMLHDFKLLMPEVEIKGIDISNYAHLNSLEDIRPHIEVGDAKCLPFPDNSFDFVIGINVVHNLPLAECIKAIKEIDRVSRKNKFIVVDAWRTEEERLRHNNWVVTCQTAMHVTEWRKLFNEIAYTGDYFWTIS